MHNPNDDYDLSKMRIVEKGRYAPQLHENQ